MAGELNEHATSLLAPATRQYDLFHRDGRQWLLLRYRDQAVTLDSGGLAWNETGIEQKQNYGDIFSVRLQSASIAGSGTLFSCTIRFRDGRQSVVTNATASGAGSNSEQTRLYGQFVRDSHARIPQNDRSRIRFHAGNADSRQKWL